MLLRAFFSLFLMPAMVFLAGTAQAGTDPPKLFEPITTVLENGLEVVVIEDHRAPVVTHMVWYKVGAADEPPLKSGIAHFLEHLMFKGTAKIGNGEFSKIVAKNGGQDNAFTSLDYTAYFQNAAADKLPLLMELEADRMSNLILNDAVVGPELQVVLEERSMRTDNNPSALFREQVTAALFLAHPYAIPVIGWRHEVEKLTTDDAIDWYKKYYAPNNAVLVVAGDVKAAAVFDLARKYYGPLESHDLPQRIRPQDPPHLAARRIEMSDKRIRQASLSRRYLIFEDTLVRHSQVVVAAVVLAVLGVIGAVVAGTVLRQPPGASGLVVLVLLTPVLARYRPLARCTTAGRDAVRAAREVETRLLTGGADVGAGDVADLLALGRVRDVTRVLDRRDEPLPPWLHDADPDEARPLRWLDVANLTTESDPARHTRERYDGQLPF